MILQILLETGNAYPAPSGSYGGPDGIRLKVFERAKP